VALNTVRSKNRQNVRVEIGTLARSSHAQQGEVQRQQKQEARNLVHPMIVTILRLKQA
jgi:hypothetical protein